MRYLRWLRAHEYLYFLPFFRCVATVGQVYLWTLVSFFLAPYRVILNSAVLHLPGAHGGHQQLFPDTSTEKARRVRAADNGHTRYTGGHCQRGGPPFYTVYTSHHLWGNRANPWWCHLWECCHGFPGGVIPPPRAHPSCTGIFWGGG